MYECMYVTKYVQCSFLFLSCFHNPVIIPTTPNLLLCPLVLYFHCYAYYYYCCSWANPFLLELLWAMESVPLLLTLLMVSLAMWMTWLVLAVPRLPLLLTLLVVLLAMVVTWLVLPVRLKLVWLVLLESLVLAISSPPLPPPLGLPVSFRIQLEVYKCIVTRTPRWNKKWELR